MTVYIEYVLIDNFVIDYMLIKASLVTLNLRVSKIRLFLCSILGSGFALLFVFLDFNGLVNFIIKILFGLILVSISAPKLSAKKLYVLFLTFIIYTFLLGGAIIAVFTALKLDYSSEISIALMIIPCYVVLGLIKSVVKFLYNRKDAVNLIFDIDVNLGKISIKERGFLDTGNGAYFLNMPIIFCRLSVFSKLLSDIKNANKIIDVKVSSIGGEKLTKGVVLDSVKIKNKESEKTITGVVLAVFNKEFSVDYGVILHPSLMENFYEKDISKTKTAC